MTIKEEIKLLIDEEIERNPSKYNVKDIDREFEKSTNLQQWNSLIEYTMGVSGGLNTLIQTSNLEMFMLGL